MISKIHICNYKLHKDTEVNSKGLTILTGMNGMGKSSIIQALILLRQSFLSNDLENGLNLKGDLCDAGISGDLACQSSKSNNFDIKLCVKDGQNLSFSFEYPKDIFETQLRSVNNNETYRQSLVRHSLFNDNFQYISAFRFGPQKSYVRDSSIAVNKKQISKYAGQCEYAVHFLYTFKNNEIYIKELAVKKNDDSIVDYRLFAQVEEWMRKIAPYIHINIEPVGEDFKLKYRFDREESTITEEMSALNTGFGITYVLPILVAILSAKKDAMILIENPEAHIHPKGQAVLMELISLAVKHGVQVVLETHSDHIINGALVWVKQKIITPDDLSIYFFNRNEEEHVAVPHELEIRKNGHIKCPPKDFFDQLNIDLRILTGIGNGEE